MKATVSRKDLTDAIARVIPAVAVKPSTPILACVYLKAENSTLTIRATNFNLDITTQISANIEVEGTVAVTGKFFAPIVNKLSGDIVTLDAADKLKIKSEAASFELLTMDAEDFPAAPKISDSGAFRMNGIALKELIRRTVFACSKDDSRPIFTGVNFIVKGEEITAVATNAARLAVFKTRILEESNANIVIPAAALRSLQNALTGNDMITCKFDEAHATFEFSNLRFITRLLGGNFPPAEKAIPTSTSTTAKINVKELLAAIDRIQAISSNDDYHQIFMTFTHDGLSISADANSIGSALEHVDATVTGNDVKIAFNASFVLDVLKILDSETVEIGMNDQFSPVIMTGEKLADFIYVLTPLRSRQ